MDLNRFVIKYLQSNDLGWLEERRLDLVPLLAKFISNVVEGKSVFIITDNERDWFANYILEKMNNLNNERFFLLPFYKLSSVVPQIDMAKSDEQFGMVEDILSISFDDYFFWYIGKEDKLLDFAKRNEDSFFWIMDVDLQNNFYLKSTDKFLNIKLIRLIDLVESVLSAALFGEIEI